MQDGVRQPGEATLRSLHTEVLRLTKLVEDLHLLSLADCRNLRVEKAPVKPFDLLKEIVDQFRTRLEQKRIGVQLALGTDEPVILEGDADRLVQLFSNLIENSLRYTDSAGLLRIYARHTEDRLTICFEDSAPGVPEEALDRLFERLYRVDKSRSRELGGSGLGLAICKQIVEIHGGTIGAYDAPSGGLLIRIDMPLMDGVSAMNEDSLGPKDSWEAVR